MSSAAEMTHDEIADWCAQRLRKMGYGFSISNCTSATHGEQPDVLGIGTWGDSIVVEVKVSRADFLADKKKPWRANPQMGMGDHRVYLTPPGLLKPEEIPYGWMLWEVHGNKRKILKVIKGKAKRTIPHPYMRDSKATEHYYAHCDREEYNHFVPEHGDKDYRKELTWMMKVMGRAIEDGFEPNRYANNYQAA